VKNIKITFYKKERPQNRIKNYDKKVTAVHFRIYAAIECQNGSVFV